MVVIIFTMCLVVDKFILDGSVPGCGSGVVEFVCAGDIVNVEVWGS
jgi:hypothetical protein